MSTHVPGGSSVCIHSVAVNPSHQRRGIALALLREYVERLRASRHSRSKTATAAVGDDGIENVERILLIAHEELCPLYSKAGFKLIGKSSVTHGARDWYEMRLILEPGTSAAISSLPAATTEVEDIDESTGRTLNALPANISQQALLDALSASSRPSKSRPKARSASSFATLADLTVDVDGEPANKYKLVCLREGCGSVILLPKVAVLKEGPSIEVRQFPGIKLFYVSEGSLISLFYVSTSPA